MEQLLGGRASIYRKGNAVYRPLQPWSSTIHCLLAHLRRSGVRETPVFLGAEGKYEKLRFVPGNTYNYPLSGAVATLEALRSAATLLRKIHDASVSFLTEGDPMNMHWMLTPKEPFEVVCHGDYAPYNVALTGNFVTGVFDFDTAHPAPRVWDLAYSVYCWAPFKADSVCQLGTLNDQVLRAKLFCESYGATKSMVNQLVDVMVGRLILLSNFIRSEAESGNEKFSNDIEEGHIEEYLNDIDYIKKNRDRILLGIDA